MNKWASIETLTALKPERKPGFFDEAVKRGTLTARGVEWTDEVHAQLRREFALEPAERKRLGLGDIVASVATPIARALGMDCVDKASGQLKPESPCAARKRMLNNLTGKG